MRRHCLALLLLPLALVAEAQDPREYRSPYRVEFSVPKSELIGDLERSERGDWRIEAEIEHAHWYSPNTRERFGSWGPEPRTYPRPREPEGSTPERKRERVIAVAMRFLGYGYQHHHVPDWDPPRGWPWKETCFGRNGKGVDCSNFTGFVFNQGFGLKLNTEVHRQSEERFATTTEGERVPLRVVALPAAYSQRIETLRTGDLVFIKNRAGRISHVVIWVGPIGKSPDGIPLILDSHGEDVRDSEGTPIPCGIHLRPFRENSWYNESASHALRLVGGD